MPLEMPDCAGHEPGFGETCYTRPDYVVTIPAAMPGVQATEKLACRKHLGYVVATFMPEFNDRHTGEATVTFYQGA